MTLSSGSQVARYRIVQFIGSGGMGEVYLAEDLTLGRKLAIKILPEQFTQDADRVRRFEQEARSASALNHPNIITIFEIGKANSENRDLHFIATEFIEGETLRKRMNILRLSLVEALEVAIQCASALQAAHSAGIAHRDIKPENIMLRPDGYVKLLDFGLAKLTEQTQTSDLANDPDAPTRSLFETQPGMVIGTVAYMSPEQARGQRVDGRTDIFSLGIVLYEMILGQRPFSGATTSDMIAALLVSEPVRLSEQLPSIPLDLERIVTRMLVKDRDARYQTAQEVVNDLKRVKARFDLTDDAAETAETARLPQPAVGFGTAALTEENATAPQGYTTNLATNIAPGGAQDPPSQPSYETNIAPAAPAVRQSGQQAVSQATANAVAATASIKPRAANKRAYWVLALVVLMIAALAIPLALRAARRNAVIDSLAVLPFINVTEDPEAEYLSEGITESLINALSRLPELSISSRNAVIQYKGKEQDARKVGQELDVKAVLIGRLTRRASDVRISAELVDTRNGRLIWSDQFARRTSDLLALQEEITQKLAGKLSPRFARAGQDSLAKAGTQDPAAYELYLKGRYYWNQGTPEAMKKADELFEEAAGKDPSYALAIAGCAACHAAGSDGETPEQSMKKAEEVALAALKRDDRLADAHLTLATVNFRYDWDFATAEREFKRAIELEPRNATAHQRYAEFLALMGRHQEANAEIWKARSLDPRSLPVNQAIGAIQYYARDYDHAVDHLKKALAIDDEFAPAHASLGLVYEQTGRKQEAVMELLRAKLLMKEDGEYLTSLKKAYVESKADGFWRRELEHLTEEARRRYVPPSSFAALHTRLGQNDLALAALEKGLAERDGGMVELKVEPLFEPLRSQSKFSELLRRIGLL